MEQFGKNIRRRASELGLTDAETARRAGLTPRRYSFYVTGSREPDLRTLLRICDVLEMSADDALREGKPSKANKREIMMSRLKSAASNVSDDRLEMLVLSAEALASEIGTNPLPTPTIKGP